MEELNGFRWFLSGFLFLPVTVLLVWMGCNSSVVVPQSPHDLSAHKFNSILPSAEPLPKLTNEDEKLDQPKESNLVTDNKGHSIDNICTVKVQNISVSNISSNATTSSEPIELKSGLIFYDTISNSQTPHSNIFSAIKRNDILTVQRILSSDSSQVNSIGMWSSTPLIVACQYGNTSIVELILSYSKHDKSLLNVNHHNEKGATALLYACMEGLDDIVHQFLHHYHCTVDNTPTHDRLYNPLLDTTLSCTPFTIAILNGRSKIVQMLLESGHCQVNLPLDIPIVRSNRLIKDNSHPSFIQSYSPLLFACAYNRLDVIKILLQHHADPFFIDSEQSTCLHYVARHKEDGLPLLHTLFPTNTSVSPRRTSVTPSPEFLHLLDINGNSALHIACEKKCLPLVQYFITTLHMNFNQFNPLTKMTPLGVAITKRSVDIVTYLLQIESIDIEQGYEVAMKLNPSHEIYQLLSHHRTKSMDRDPSDPMDQRVVKFDPAGLLFSGSKSREMDPMDHSHPSASDLASVSASSSVLGLAMESWINFQQQPTIPSIDEEATEPPLSQLSPPRPLIIDDSLDSSDPPPFPLETNPSKTSSSSVNLRSSFQRQQASLSRLITVPSHYQLLSNQVPPSTSPTIVSSPSNKYLVKDPILSMKYQPKPPAEGSRPQQPALPNVRRKTRRHVVSTQTDSTSEDTLKTNKTFNDLPVVTQMEGSEVVLMSVTAQKDSSSSRIKSQLHTNHIGSISDERDPVDEDDPTVLEVKKQLFKNEEGVISKRKTSELSTTRQKIFDVYGVTSKGSSNPSTGLEMKNPPIR